MAREAPRLRRCGSLWGTADRVEADPALEIVADALYLPEEADGSCGLFDGGRSLGETGQPVPARLAPELVEPAPEGVYLYIGPLILHYGHFLVDTLSRLWPLAAWEGPRPKLLCHRLAGHAEGPEHAYVHEILAGLGLVPADLISFDRAVRLPLVTVPGKGFRERACVHAVFGEVCRRVGARHWDPAEADAVARPLYLSKARLRAGMTRIVEEARVEAELDRRGVEIVYPESLDFAAQVRVLAARRTILGPLGSALHTAAFSAPRRRLVALNMSDLMHPNYALFDGLNGTEGRYYWAPGTRYAPSEGFGVGWSLPEPEAVARELLERAEDFDRLDERDAADEAARARRARRLGARLGRLRKDLAARLERALDGLRRPG